MTSRRSQERSKPLPRGSRTLRARDALWETLANLRARWLSTLSVFVAVFVAAFGSTAMVVVETSEIASYQQDLYEQGATGFVIASNGDGSTLSASRCEELNHIEGVVSAGARGDLVPNSSEVPMRQVTSGYLRSVHPGEGGSVSTIAGSGIAVTKHFVQNSGIVLSSSVVRLDAVADKSLRDPRIDGEILQVVPAAAMQARECVVIGSTSSTRGVEGLLTNWFAPQKTSVAPLAPKLAAAVSPHDRFAARSSLTVPIAAGVVAVLVLVGVWVSRRSDFALYRLLGARRGPLVFGLAMECLLLVTVPSVSGIAFAAAMNPEFLAGPVLQGVLLAALQFLVAGLAALPAGILVLLTKNPSSLIREGT